MNIDENVQKVIKLLLRKWKLLILFMLIGALLAGVYTAKFTTLTYTSSVEFLAAAVDPAHEISDSTGEVARTSQTSKMNYAMKMIDTYIEIFKTNKFCGKVAGEMNKKYYTNLSPADIKQSFTIETVENHRPHPVLQHRSPNGGERAGADGGNQQRPGSDYRGGQGH